jgi:hypothetical protein
MHKDFRYCLLSRLLLFCSLFFAMGLVHAESGTYGKTLIKTIDLPFEDIARFERFNSSPTNRFGQPKQAAGLFPDYDEWVSSEETLLSSSHGPYTIVVKTHGIGTNKGEASVRWLAGWDNQYQIALGSAKKVAPDQPVEIVSVSPSVRMKKDTRLNLGLGFAKVDNFRIDRVQVEIWSGLRDTSFLETLGAFRYLLTGLIMVALLFWFRRL